MQYSEQDDDYKQLNFKDLHNNIIKFRTPRFAEWDEELKQKLLDWNEKIRMPSTNFIERTNPLMRTRKRFELNK
ncbi:unnamed protein product (macronuclear) [Paramecium tetraurelia]|uniref:Uncharacterized protein n=1 Tax=Paramecium tetraurelia TaxID=5888 RepID=A0DXI7_PARTE|nr:uncharacterized protein GSPATT00039828001 [Paramecium tetraurelia]CAK87754.1 unnamed protein product [Paramecium tetraurelia]|eukprot:XP_001455151.1 hypothetical protein (macronuclear) [Paramecium tetraurelia strain d4-2]